MVFLKVIFVVWVILGIMDVVLTVLNEVVQVLAPLAEKYTRDLIESVFALASIPTWRLVVFNISIFLALIVCRVQMLFWLLQLH